MSLDRCMDSYPHQMSPMPFTQHNHPGFETAPPQMKIDPARVPASYDVWPYGGNYGYPFPCQGCCNHGYFPGYYSCRPPYPHFPQPFPFNYHGGYPQFPDPYQGQYAPHQLYSVVQPSYEYEKNAPGNYHCCVCPNHSCNVRNKDFKIEEQKPEVNENNCDSLAPMELKNSAYPIVWFPPGCLKNKEHGSPFESNVNNWDKVPYENGSQSKLNGDRNQFSLPIIWMPSNDKPEKAERKNLKESNSSQSVEAWPSHSMVVPWKSPNSDDNEKKSKSNEKNSSSDEMESKMTEKSANRKSIPVKQMEPYGEMRITSEGNERKVSDTPMMHVHNAGTENPHESSQRHHPSARRKTSSQPKTTKLPPICLRVDPLPRGKNGNGSKRSLSPPGHKGKSQEALDKMVSTSALTGLKENNQESSQSPDHITDKSKKTDPNKKERRVIEVTEMPAGKKDDVNLKKEKETVDLPVGLHTEVSGAKKNHGTVVGQCNNAAEKRAGIKSEGACKETEKPQLSCGGCELGKDSGTTQSKEKKSEEMFKVEKRNLSEEEAVKIIQSAYRGYEVRKWELLYKLKQIAKIREHAGDVGSRIQTLQSSFQSQHHRDEKQKVILGETIMSLLLKLDTIQGLPPSLRDVRKSVARELTGLQERLDSLSSQASEGFHEEAPTKLQDQCTDTDNDECRRGKDEEGKEVKSSGEHSVNNHQCHSPCEVDVVAGSQGELTSELSPVDETNTMAEILVSSELETKMVEPELITECKDEEGNSQEMMPEIQQESYESSSDPLREQSIILPATVEETPNSVMHFKVCPGDGSAGEVESQMAENDDSKPTDMDLEINLLPELPQEVADEKIFVPQCEQLQNIKEGEDEILAAHAKQAGDFESYIENDFSSPENGDPAGVQQGSLEALKEGLLNCNSVKLDLPEDKKVLGNDNVQVGVVQAQGVVIHENRKICEAEESEQVFSLMEEECHGEDQMCKEVSNVETSTMNVEPKMEVEQLQGWNFSPKHEHPGASEAESSQLGLFAVDEGSYSVEQESHEQHDADQSSPEPTIVATSQDNEILIEEVMTSLELPVEDSSKDNINWLKATGELEEQGEVSQEEKVKSKELESESDKLKLLAEPNRFETVKDNVLVGKLSGPVVAEQHEEEDEVSPVSSTISHASIKEITESDMLVEENKRLREMMEKLIEAGKEQVTVITNLSERVKGLEKRLSRKKKSTRTRRYMAPTVSGLACIKSPIDSMKKRDVGSAM